MTQWYAAHAKFVSSRSFENLALWSVFGDIGVVKNNRLNFSFFFKLLILWYTSNIVFNYIKSNNKLILIFFLQKS